MTAGLVSQLKGLRALLLLLAAFVRLWLYDDAWGQGMYFRCDATSGKILESSMGFLLPSQPLPRKLRVPSLTSLLKWVISGNGVPLLGKGGRSKRSLRHTLFIWWRYPSIISGGLLAKQTFMEHLPCSWRSGNAEMDTIWSLSLRISQFSGSHRHINNWLQVNVIGAIVEQ